MKQLIHNNGITQILQQMQVLEQPSLSQLDNRKVHEHDYANNQAPLNGVPNLLEGLEPLKIDIHIMFM